MLRINGRENCFCPPCQSSATKVRQNKTSSVTGVGIWIVEDANRSESASSKGEIVHNIF